jgi:hypothetical protein
MSISITDFKPFSKIPNGGLKGELDLIQVTEYVNVRIPKIKEFIPDQPNFFISRESWQLLIDGKTISGGSEKNWLPPNYEVYGFVFCIATHRNHGNKPNHQERAYFRIRTIIKEISVIDSTDLYKIPVLVETDNIAFVELTKALRNNSTPVPSPLENCLEFIAKDDIGSIIGTSGLPLKNEIDLEVKDWKDKQLAKTSIIKFIDVLENRVPIEQEGAIFSKNRIKEILTKYSEAKGTTIDIALSITKPAFNFYFDINPGFTTDGMPCPPPEPACQYPLEQPQ